MIHLAYDSSLRLIVCWERSIACCDPMAKSMGAAGAQTGNDAPGSRYVAVLLQHAER